MVSMPMVEGPLCFTVSRPWRAQIDIRKRQCTNPPKSASLKSAPAKVRPTEVRPAEVRPVRFARGGSPR